MDLADAAQNVLGPMGFEVLEVDVTGQGGKRRVLLRIDRQDEAIVSMEDVTLATQVFSLELDRLDPFEGAYQLDVTSPGSERPLFTARHFERFHDLLAKVTVGGETFKGKILGVKGGTVTFRVDGNERDYKLSQIKARLAEWPSEPR